MQYLPHMPETPGGSVLGTAHASSVAHGCNLREVKAEGSEVQEHPQLHRETEASLDQKLSLKKNNNTLEFRAITLSWVISFDYDLVILQYFPLYLFWITVI